MVQLVQEAIERRGDVKIEVCAILNDTTGTILHTAGQKVKKVQAKKTS